MSVETKPGIPLLDVLIRLSSSALHADVEALRRRRPLLRWDRPLHVAVREAVRNAPKEHVERWSIGTRSILGSLPEHRVRDLRLAYVRRMWRLDGGVLLKLVCSLQDRVPWDSPLDTETAKSFAEAAWLVNLVLAFLELQRRREERIGRPAESSVRRERGVLRRVT